MFKLSYTLLTDPLGLPIDPLWEYVILWIVGEIVHNISWNASPGGTFGSLVYWVTKLFAYFAIWAVLYVSISVVKFVIAHWVWLAAGAATIFLGVGMWWLLKKRRWPPNHISG